MNILLCGARGFIGQAIGAALRARGHRVVEGVSARGSSRHAVETPDCITVDFVADTRPDAWLPRLHGIDAVVNAVGVLRDSARRPMAQISALGIAGSRTAYARTKLAAEARLTALTREGRLDGTVVRPSIVFGHGGESSALFLMLARLPWLVLPRQVLDARVQPIAIAEFAAGIAALVDTPPRSKGNGGGTGDVRIGIDAVGEGRANRGFGNGEILLPAVGPESVTLSGFIASLRAQAGRAPARTARLPDVLTRWSARAGDLVPIAPWCSETLDLLGSDNVAPPGPFERLLGRPATRYDAFLREVSP